MAVFQPWMVPEVNQGFWAALARGEFLTDAAAVAGTHRWRGLKWVRAAGGVRPRRGRDLKGRCVTFAEREEIALAHAGGETMRSIARQLGRSPSTISRELARNADHCGCYRATTAHALAYERASRPKPAKLHVNRRLRQIVEQDLQHRFGAWLIGIGLNVCRSLIRPRRRSATSLDALIDQGEAVKLVVAPASFLPVGGMGCVLANCLVVRVG